MPFSLALFHHWRPVAFAEWASAGAARRQGQPSVHATGHQHQISFRGARKFRHFESVAAFSYRE